MDSILSNLIHATFINNSYHRPLTVNGVEFPLKEGTPTASGYYKNGHKVWKKGNQLTWITYTSARKEVVIEQVVVFKIKNNKYILKQHTGFNGVNLLKINEPAYLIEYLYELRGEHDKAQEVRDTMY